MDTDGAVTPEAHDPVAEAVDLVLLREAAQIGALRPAGSGHDVYVGMRAALALVHEAPELLPVLMEATGCVCASGISRADYAAFRRSFGQDMARRIGAAMAAASGGGEGVTE